MAHDMTNCYEVAWQQVKSARTKPRSGGLGTARMSRSCAVIAGLACLVPWFGARAAELSVGDITIRPGRTAEVVVSGDINGESTFGWTIMLELVPRQGSRGSVSFTSVPAGHAQGRPSFVIHKTSKNEDAVRINQVRRAGVDIRQLEDAWPEVGSFTAFDTQQAGAPVLNGAVDDNGTFVAAPLTFSGGMASFPVKASPDARGVWDVTLRTSAGDSSWEGLETTLTGGTIAIGRGVCEQHRDCDDGDPCTRDICRAGTCAHVPDKRACRESESAGKRGRK